MSPKHDSLVLLTGSRVEGVWSSSGSGDGSDGLVSSVTVSSGGTGEVPSLGDVPFDGSCAVSSGSGGRGSSISL